MDRELWKITADPRKQRGGVHLPGVFRDPTSGQEWTLLGLSKAHFHRANARAGNGR